MLVLPSRIAPAPRRLRITVASCVETLPAKIFEASQHGIPATSMHSLAVKGTPWSGPMPIASASRCSAARASASACS
jgi:hypothetical protein